jgi:hypothetical protein
MATIIGGATGREAPIRVGLAAMLAVAALAPPATAEEATVRRPIEAAILHEGTLDMVAYYLPVGEGKLEVTATFVPRAGRLSALPMRTVMVLAEGDDVSFAMPGHPLALYRFMRDGEAVTASVRQVGPVAGDAGESVAAAE